MQAGGFGEPPHPRGVTAGPARRHVHDGVAAGLAVPRQLLRLQLLVVEDAGVGGLTTGSPEIAEGVLVHQGDAERLRVNRSGDRLNGHRSYPSNRLCRCLLRPQERPALLSRNHRSETRPIHRVAQLASRSISASPITVETASIPVALIPRLSSAR